MFAVIVEPRGSTNCKAFYNIEGREELASISHLLLSCPRDSTIGIKQLHQALSWYRPRHLKELAVLRLAKKAFLSTEIVRYVTC
jgi:hypothetical protein